MDFDRALAWSHYAQRALAAEPALRSELLTTVEAPFDWTVAARALATVTAGDDAPAFAAELRRLRRRLFLHTLFRDLTDRADLDEVLGAVTRLAEIAIEAAVGFHARHPTLGPWPRTRRFTAAPNAAAARPSGRASARIAMPGTR